MTPETLEALLILITQNFDWRKQRRERRKQRRERRKQRRERPNPLAQYSTEQLLAELERRGWPIDQWCV
jgi:hypothetical protein